jgi:hypothetical protein
VRCDAARAPPPRRRHARGVGGGGSIDLLCALALPLPAPLSGSTDPRTLPPAFLVIQWHWRQCLVAACGLQRARHLAASSSTYYIYSGRVILSSWRLRARARRAAARARRAAPPPPPRARGIDAISIAADHQQHRRSPLTPLAVARGPHQRPRGMAFGSKGVEFVFGPAVFNESGGSTEDLGRADAGEQLTEYTAALSLMAEYGCFHLDNARAYGGGLAEHDMGVALAALPTAVREKMMVRSAVATVCVPGCHLTQRLLAAVHGRCTRKSRQGRLIFRPRADSV